MMKTTVSTSKDVATNQQKSSGIVAVDPVTGKQVDLAYQAMTLHPCEIIAENPEAFSDDPVAVQVSSVFHHYLRQGKIPPTAARISATRVEASDLFDPELLSDNFK
ncbi:hypothetical protein MHU86_24370 [Fragilaria crotonensis]|nr:hypothetical protein MHU86_24370 [Fragilaria crotonensis]